MADRNPLCAFRPKLVKKEFPILIMVCLVKTYSTMIGTFHVHFFAPPPPTINCLMVGWVPFLFVHLKGRRNDKKHGDESQHRVPQYDIRISGHDENHVYGGSSIYIPRYSNMPQHHGTKNRMSPISFGRVSSRTLKKRSSIYYTIWRLKLV